jgi:tetratricopeptide (TPR) repeat protein
MHEKAINCCDKAIILNLNDPILYLNKADLLLNLERNDEAIYFFDKI